MSSRTLVDLRQVQRQIGSLLYERTGLSTDKESVIRRASSQDSPASIATIRTFLNSRSSPNGPGITRRISSPPSSIICKHSSWNRGTGFCFEARQKRITIGNEHAKQLLVISLSDEKAWRLGKTCRKNSRRRD